MKTELKKMFIKNTGFLMLLFASIVNADEDKLMTWQLNSIHFPSESQLKNEAKGRITIYDGLTDIQVVDAMEKQFSRIENMMFINTRITDYTGSELYDDDTGEYLTESDGCD